MINKYEREKYIKKYFNNFFQLTVFKPFFISMNLPYSVIRGEIVAIPIVVFNYMSKDLSVEVVLENNGDFEFAEVSNEVHETKRM